MPDFTTQFSDVLDELRATGADPDILDRLERTVEAAPLRQQITSLKEQLGQAETERSTLRGQVSQQVFKDVGITMNPDLLKTPDDLDVTNPDAVRAWAIDQKLIEPKPNVSAEELAGHDAINNAGAGAEGTDAGTLTPESVSSWPMDKLLRLKESNPDAFEALKRGETVRGVAVG